MTVREFHITRIYVYVFTYDCTYGLIRANKGIMEARRETLIIKAVFKNMETVKNLEKIFKGLANRRRLAIIKFLSQKKEATVADIAERLRLSFKATSKHLAILRQLDIVDSRQQSLNVYYRLVDVLPLVVGNVFKHISNSRE